MCGIYGFAGFREDGLLGKMSHALRHRGPGGAAHFMAPGGAALEMGARELGSASPGSAVLAQEGSVAVAVDGDIGNAPELAEELRAAGRMVRTGSEADIIAHGYAEWGLEGLLGRLVGAFAFALHDTDRGELILACDRFGQKPLYYTQAGARFLFASEIKALVQSAHVEARPNIKAIDPYLTLGHVPEPQTLFAGIFALPSAHYLRHQASGAVELARYWEIPLPTPEERVFQKDEAWLEAFAALWEEAARRTLGGVASVGACLDGGAGMPLLAATLARHRAGFPAYSIAFTPETEGQNGAGELAAFLGASHRPVPVLAEDFSLLPEVTWHLDLPAGEARALAFYKVAQHAAQDIQALFAADGADETLAGHDAHQALAWVETFRRLAPKTLRRGVVLPGFRLAPWKLARFFSQLPPSLGREDKKRFLDFLQHHDQRDAGHNAAVLRALWALDERRALYSDEFKSLASEAWMASGSGADDGATLLDRVLKHELHYSLPSGVLLDAGKTASAFSLARGLPFLDHRLAAFAFTLPGHLRLSGRTGGVIARRLAEKTLPKRLARQRTPPAYFPPAYFFDHPEFKTLLADTLDPGQLKKRGYFQLRRVAALIEAAAATRDPAACRQLMSLVSLEIWHRVFVDKQYAFE